MDFPDPDRPTSAVQELGGIEIETFFNTDVVGREGYWKFTLVSLMGVSLETVKLPRCSWDPSCERFARRISCVAISREVLIWGTRKGLAEYFEVIQGLLTP